MLQCLMHFSPRFHLNFQMSFTSERPKQRGTKRDANASWFHGHIMKFSVGTLIDKIFVASDRDASVHQWKLFRYSRLNSRLFTCLRWILGQTEPHTLIISEKWPTVDGFVCKWLPSVLEPATAVVEGKRAICLH